MSHRNVWVSLVIVVLVIVLGYWGYSSWYAQKNSTETEQSNAVITHFKIEKPYFVITGRALSKVEVWANVTPVGGVSASNVFVGDATPSSAKINDEQRWTLAIPTEPIAANTIYARGWDVEGNEVPQVSLPFSGVTEIFSQVWGVVKEEQGALRVGESMTFGDLTFSLSRIVNDSRCPVSVTCVTAGNVTLELNAKTPRTQQMIEVKSGANPTLFDGYFIEVASVEPVKGLDPLGQDQYRVVFVVSRNTKL